MEYPPSTSFDPSMEPVVDPYCLRCQECGEIKSSTRTLFDHLFEHHNYDKARIARLKQQRRARSTHIKAVRNARHPHVCEICEKVFLSRSGLLHHGETFHELKRAPAVRIPCPISSCIARFYTYMELATHADVEHRNETVDRNAFRVYKKRFADIFSLQAWRTEKELETDTKFLMRSSETKFSYGRRVVMWNCAKGFSRNKDKPCKPCPAFLRVCERHCGTFEVVACFGHLGHPHPSLRAPTSCTVRLQTAGGRIVAVHDVLEVAEVAEEFLPYEESVNYEIVDDNDEDMDGLTAK
ncbi:hypothetical protein Aduo_011631 [Ancylostoma duodenale]